VLLSLKNTVWEDAFESKTGLTQCFLGAQAVDTTDFLQWA
jgi:gamma-glutamylcysteine synthetase